MALSHDPQGLRLPHASQDLKRAKLVAVDLDGTLLDLRGRPHESDVRALRAALDAGVRVSIITGRLYSGTRPMAELLRLRGTVGCADGSHLVDTRRHATLLHLGVQGKEARILRDALAAAGVTTFVFAQDAIGLDAAGTPFVEYVTTWSRDLRPSEDVYRHKLWDTEDGVTAVVAVGLPEQINDAAQSIARELPAAAVVAKFPIRRGAHQGLWAIIIRAAGGTKGTALRLIAERERVSLEDTVCVGDWINDVAMFELAGRSFAMGQSPAEVKATATDVLAETVDSGGGIARAIKEACGIAAE
jgi:hydroxymethylpyrimidine pyrophosphatase-like HAD family hydrolase